MAKHVTFEKLHAFVKETLEAVGVNSQCSARVADGLVEASERGVDTHGIALLQHYVHNVKAGGVNTNPSFVKHAVFPTMTVLDADHGFGLSAGYEALAHAMPVARRMGMAAVSIRNSTHCGAMAALTLRGARCGFITVAMTNTDPRMLSTGGVRSYFGTNPIAVAAPRSGGGPPFSYDAATTAIPFNKVMVARRARKALPEGLAADGTGQTTTDAEKAEQLHPFGGYKGFGLAAVVEVLTGVLAAMPFARHFAPMYGPDAKDDVKRNVSHVVLLLRPDAVDAANAASPPLMEEDEAVRVATGAGLEEMSEEGQAMVREAVQAWRIGEGPPPHACGTVPHPVTAAPTAAAAAGVTNTSSSSSSSSSGGGTGEAREFAAATAAACLPSSDSSAPSWCRGTFQDRLGRMTQEVRSEPEAAKGGSGPPLAVTGGGGVAGEGVMLAGDPQERIRGQRRMHGIPIPAETVDAFTALAGETGVKCAFSD